MATEVMGSAVYFEWIHSGGTIVLSVDHRNFSYTPSIEYVDATCGADTARQRINSFTDGVVTISGLWQDNFGTASVAGLAEGTDGTINFGIQGTASAAPKATIPAKSGGLVYNAAYNDVISYNVTFQQNGARTDGAY